MNPLPFGNNVPIVNPSGVPTRLSLIDLSATLLDILVSNRETAEQTTNSNANCFYKN